MKAININKRKAVAVLTLGLLVFFTHTNLWADERKVATVKVYGTVESSNLYQKTFTFQSGEKISLTEKTIIKDNNGNRAAFRDIAKPGVRLGIKAKEIDAQNFTALLIWENNENY